MVAEDHIHEIYTYFPTLTERCKVEGCGLELTEEEMKEVYNEWLTRENTLKLGNVK